MVMVSAVRSVSTDERAVALRALDWACDASSHGHEGVGSPPRIPAAAEWHTLSSTDVRAYLDELLMARHPDAGLEALLSVGFLDVWLPEVSAMVGFGDGEWRHKDVWKHTKQVVYQSVPRLAVRWGALLHDIGKMRTRSIGPGGEVHFFGHSEVGASMFRKRVAKRIEFEEALHSRIHFLILHHLRASQYDGSWTDSAVRRFANEMGDGLTDLLDLSRADITTKRPEKRKHGLRQISELSARIREIQARDRQQPVLPKDIGNAIMARFSLPPSKKIGWLKDHLERAIEQGELVARADVDVYLDYLNQRRSELDL
jgi:poly(A) polymerase